MPTSKGRRHAYGSKENEAHLARHGFVSRIHVKKPKGRPMPQATRRANAGKSKERSAVEHVFAHEKIGLVNLAYNMRRFVWLDRRDLAIIA